MNLRALEKVGTRSTLSRHLDSHRLENRGDVSCREHDDTIIISHDQITRRNFNPTAHNGNVVCHHLRTTTCVVRRDAVRKNCVAQLGHLPHITYGSVAIVEVARDNQTDGYRMVTAFVQRKLGRPVNRKRVLRVMRERKLIQRRRPLERRKRPGFFRVERPRQLWQLDMTSVWVAEHGWCYLNAIIDCCTREIVAWQLELRCRADEATPSSNAPPLCTGSSSAS